MDMLNILKNFDSAAKGEKPSTTAKDVNSMKTILESFDAVDECGMDMPPAPAPMPQQDKVKMNVNLNADGIDAIEDLIKLMGGNIGGHLEPDGDEMPMAMKLPMPMPKDSDDERGDMAKMIAMTSDKPKGLEDDVEEDWDNSPDEEYADHNTMVKDLSGGINREKKQYAKAQDGDNPMAVESIKEQLWAALNEKKKCKSKKMDEEALSKEYADAKKKKGIALAAKRSDTPSQSKKK